MCVSKYMHKDLRHVADGEYFPLKLVGCVMCAQIRCFLTHNTCILCAKGHSVNSSVLIILLSVFVVADTPEIINYEGCLHTFGHTV